MLIQSFMTFYLDYLMGKTNSVSMASTIFLFQRNTQMATTEKIGISDEQILQLNNKIVANPIRS